MLSQNLENKIQNCEIQTKRQNCEKILRKKKSDLEETCNSKKKKMRYQHLKKEVRIVRFKLGEKKNKMKFKINFVLQEMCQPRNSEKRINFNVNSKL